MNSYDIIIIGAGPAGLALAYFLKSKNLKILIVDRENSIGGCHRVRRVKMNDEELFSEHGPRIYLSSFVNYIELLKDFGFDFNDLYKTDSTLDTFKIIKENLLPNITIKEVLVLIYIFIIYLFNDNYGIDITMHDFMINYNFSQKTYDFIDKLCVATDGGNAKKYTLNKFLTGSDQNSFYKGYQPILPNDIGIFKIWKDNLKEVDFLLNTEIINITEKSIITKDNKIINGNKIILAVPPVNLIKILNNIPSEKIKNCFGDIKELNKWSEDTKYLYYITVVFHWNKKLILEEKASFATNTEWCIMQEILSNVMTFGTKSSKTVISCAITKRDIISNRINKTANECSKEELIDEVYNQLLTKYQKLPKPTFSVISPGNYIKNNEWIDVDTAFISTANKFNYIPFQSKSIPSLYNLGTHNGYSLYKYTSIEAAISNAKALALQLYPDLSEKYQIKAPLWTIKNVLCLLLIILIIVILCFYIKD